MYNLAFTVGLNSLLFRLDRYNKKRKHNKKRRVGGAENSAEKILKQIKLCCKNYNVFQNSCQESRLIKGVLLVLFLLTAIPKVL